MDIPVKRSRQAAYMKNAYNTPKGRAKQQIKYYMKKFKDDDEAQLIFNDPNTTIVQKLLKIKEYNFFASLK